MRKRGLYLLSFLVLLSGLFTFTGCADFTVTEGNNYNTLTVKKGLAHFSFEFPSDYNVGKVEVRNDRGLKYTSLSAIGPPLGEYGDSTWICVDVANPTITSPNYKAAAENSLTSSKNLPHFRLLEQAPITVHSVPGLKVIYYYKRFRRDWDREATIPHVIRKVYFDYGGLIWEIDLRSYEATAEADQAVFEHILETLRITETVELSD